MFFLFNITDQTILNHYRTVCIYWIFYTPTDMKILAHELHVANLINCNYQNYYNLSLNQNLTSRLIQQYSQLDY